MGMSVIDEIKNDKSFKDEQKKMLIELYNYYLTTINKTDSKLKSLVDDVLSTLFKNKYEFSVPMAFIESEIGRIILKLKLEMEEPLKIGVTEASVLADRTRAAIIKAIESERIIAEKVGGRYLIHEKDLLAYITRNRIFTEEEAEKRINTYKKLIKENKIVSIKEIKEELKK